LLVGKSPSLQNNVTGQKYNITYGASGTPPAARPLTPIDPAYVTSQFGENQGQAKFDHAGRRFVEPSAIGDVAEASYLGTTRPYYINHGKLVTEIAGTPIETTVYKLGDKYIGARSNEFGYANYEIIPEVPELNPLGPGKLQLR
jgi:hypothetical protein